MQWAIEKKASLAFALALAMLLAVGVISYRSIAGFADAANRVSHTHEVIGKLNDVLATVTDAESAVRGYIITGNESLWERYQAAANAHEDTLRLLSPVADNQRSGGQGCAQREA